MASMIARPMERARSARGDISSCHCRCCCNVSPRPSWYSCCLSSSSLFQGASPGAAEVSFQLSSTISTLGSASASPSLSLDASWAGSSPPEGASRSLGPAPRASKLAVASVSSSASSMTLVSSSSRIWACSSREGSCSSLIACCSCGVMVSCWPRRSCREAFNIYLHAEILTQVHLTNSFVGKDFFRTSGSDHRAAIHDTGPVTHAERFPHVMIGDQHADAARGQFGDDFLDVQHRDRIHAREGLIQQDEARRGGQRARDFHAPPFAARQCHAGAAAHMPDVQLLEDAFQLCFARGAVQIAARLKDGADVVFHGQAAEYRGLLRQVAQSQPRPLVH